MPSSRVAPVRRFFEAHSARTTGSSATRSGSRSASSSPRGIGGAVEIAPLFTIDETVEDAPDMRVYTPLEQAGRDIYIREGCYACHSQMIRTLRDEVDRWGPYSLAVESKYDHPMLWGSKRTGPDLARVGGKYSDDWQVAHLYYPRDVSPDSVMPHYRWLARRQLEIARPARAARGAARRRRALHRRADRERGAATRSARLDPDGEHADGADRALRRGDQRPQLRRSGRRSDRDGRAGRLPAGARPADRPAETIAAAQARSEEE